MSRHSKHSRVSLVTDSGRWRKRLLKPLSAATATRRHNRSAAQSMLLGAAVLLLAAATLPTQVAAQNTWELPGGAPPAYGAGINGGYVTELFCSDPLTACNFNDTRNALISGFWGNDFGSLLTSNRACEIINCSHEPEGLVQTLVNGLGTGVTEVHWWIRADAEMHCECPPNSGGPHTNVNGQANVNTTINFQVKTVPPGQTVTVEASWWGMLVLDCQGTADIASLDNLSLKINNQQLLPPSWTNVVTTGVKTLAYYPPPSTAPLTFTATDGDIFAIDVQGTAFGWAGNPGIEDNFGWSDWANASFQGGLYLALSPATAPNLTNPAYAAAQAVFSVDIGSDTELSDPVPTGNEVFDPGDLYPWHGPALPAGGADGVNDDAWIFGVDYWPATPDTIAPSTGAMTCAGLSAANIPAITDDRFDLDGTDLLDVDLQSIIPPSPVPTPIAQFPSTCIHDGAHLVISFNDDWSGHYAGSLCEVPVATTSPIGETWGRSVWSDEVLGVDITPVLIPGAAVFSSATYPVYGEVGLHTSLAPDPGPPGSLQEADDDVDALDVCVSGNGTVWYFSPDHEATGIFGGWGALDPGGIYQVSALGGIAAQVVDENVHLGLIEDTDIDAFEFVWLRPCDICAPALALVFSVAPDDYLTIGVDESGALDPNRLYASFLDGASYELTGNAFVDDIDAITAVPLPMLPAGGQTPKPLPCAGDTNCDGVVDLFDIDSFVLAVTSATNTPPFASYYALFPNCDPYRADINGDGVVNLFDVDPFVNLLTSPTPILCP